MQPNHQSNKVQHLCLVHSGSCADVETAAVLDAFPEANDLVFTRLQKDPGFDYCFSATSAVSDDALFNIPGFRLEFCTPDSVTAIPESSDGGGGFAEFLGRDCPVGLSDSSDDEGPSDQAEASPTGAGLSGSSPAKVRRANFGSALATYFTTDGSGKVIANRCDVCEVIFKSANCTL